MTATTIPNTATPIMSNFRYATKANPATKYGNVVDFKIDLKLSAIPNAGNNPPATLNQCCNVGLIIFNTLDTNEEPK